MLPAFLLYSMQFCLVGFPARMQTFSAAQAKDATQEQIPAWLCLSSDKYLLTWLRKPAAAMALYLGSAGAATAATAAAFCTSCSSWLAITACSRYLQQTMDALVRYNKQ